MSADLLEAFGEVDQGKLQRPGISSTTTSQPKPYSSTGTDDHRTSHGPALVEETAIPRKDEYLWRTEADGNDILFDAEEEMAADDFGDFAEIEERPTTTEEALKPLDATFGDTPTQPSLGKGTPIDLLSLDDQPQNPLTADMSGISSVTPRTTASTGLHIKEQTVSTDYLDDDGWGDFETTERQQPVQQELNSQPSQQANTKSKASKSPGPTVKRQQQQQPPPPPPPPEPELDEDDWATFEDGQPEPEPAPAPSRPFLTPKTAPKTTKPTISLSPSKERPTNVPPPSLLLSLLPIIIPSLLTTTSSSSPSLAATQIITVHHTAARIIAGRANRWKRDTLLAQSTRIAGAGKPGGMKLTSVNKAESVKEEREAAEAVEVWNRNLHHWQAVISKAKLSAAGGLKLSVTVGVKAASGPGVMEDRVICALCGLKRSERVIGVDEGVDDVFGEFWIEGWGHRECSEWWEAWKIELKQR